MMDAREIAPTVIVMPSDGLCRDGSGYLTHPYAEDAEQWIVEEVPVIAQLAAPALCADAKVCIAGLSMGGYGALRLGAKYADRFSAISVHSAITDVMGMQSFAEEPVSEFLQCGPREELSAIYWLLKHRNRLPKIRFDCGVDDDLIEANRSLHRALQNMGLLVLFSCTSKAQGPRDMRLPVLPFMSACELLVGVRDSFCFAALLCFEKCRVRASSSAPQTFDMWSH